MRVTISSELGLLWATPEELADMSDQEIIDLVKEDVTAFLEGATWTVENEGTKERRQVAWCDGCDGTGLMEGWNQRDGNDCPKCKGSGIVPT